VTNPDDDIDWALTTWEGARREQLRRWLRLSVRERLEAVDRMGRTAEELARLHKAPAAEPLGSAQKRSDRGGSD
jgi:hypothetical protein